MVSTFGALTCQWFPHLEPKRVNGFHFWRPNPSMISTLWTYTTGFQWNSFGHHWHVLAPNVETIDTFGLRVSTVKMAFFLFFRQNQGNQDFSPVHKWLFRSQLQHIKSFWNMIGSLLSNKIVTPFFGFRHSFSNIHIFCPQLWKVSKG